MTRYRSDHEERRGTSKEQDRRQQGVTVRTAQEIMVQKLMAVVEGGALAHSAPEDQQMLKEVVSTLMHGGYNGYNGYNGGSAGSSQGLFLQGGRADFDSLSIDPDYEDSTIRYQITGEKSVRGRIVGGVSCITGLALWAYRQRQMVGMFDGGGGGGIRFDSF